MNASLAQRTALAENVTAAALVSWLARSHALNKSNRGLVSTAEEIGAPPVIIESIKAAVGAEGMYSHPDLAGNSAAVAAFINATSESSILLRLINDGALLRVPLQTRLLALGADFTAAVVGEGAPIPLQGFDLGSQTIEPFKVAALIALSDELWGNLSSPGQTYVNTKLREAVSQVADAEFLARIVTGGTPNLTAANNADAAIRAALRAMLDAVHVRPGARLHWAVSPGAANALATLDTPLTDLNPFAGTILGLPATITMGLTGRKLMLIDGRGVAGDVVSLRVESSNQAALQMADNPTNNSVTPTATTLVSLWQNNATAVKAVLTLGLEPLREVVAAVLTLEDLA